MDLLYSLYTMAAFKVLWKVYQTASSAKFVSFYGGQSK